MFITYLGILLAALSTVVNTIALLDPSSAVRKRVSVRLEQTLERLIASRRLVQARFRRGATEFRGDEGGRFPLTPSSGIVLLLGGTGASLMWYGMLGMDHSTFPQNPGPGWGLGMSLLSIASIVYVWSARPKRRFVRVAVALLIVVPLAILTTAGQVGDAPAGEGTASPPHTMSS